VESYLVGVAGRWIVGVVWLIGGDLEEILLSNGGVEARAGRCAGAHGCQ
jgi:hypothetical protein